MLTWFCLCGPVVFMAVGCLTYLGASNSPSSFVVASIYGDYVDIWGWHRYCQTFSTSQLVERGAILKRTIHSTGPLNLRRMETNNQSIWRQHYADCSTGPLSHHFQSYCTVQYIMSPALLANNAYSAYSVQATHPNRLCCAGACCTVLYCAVRAVAPADAMETLHSESYGHHEWMEWSNKLAECVRYTVRGITCCMFRAQVLLLYNMRPCDHF